MKKVFRLIRMLFCDHLYFDGVMNPFIDENGNHSATYTCSKCGYKKFVTFERR